MATWFRKVAQIKSLTIRARLTIWYISVALGLLSVCAGIGIGVLRAILIDNTDRALMVDAQRFITQIIPGGRISKQRPPGEPLVPPDLVASVAKLTISEPVFDSSGDPIFVELRTDNGTVEAASSNVMPHGFVARCLDAGWRAPRGTVETQFVGSDASTVLRVASVRVPRCNMTLVLAVPWSRTDRVIGPAFAASVAVIGFVTFLSGFGAWHLVGRTLKPIDDIVTEVERNHGQRLPPEFSPNVVPSDDEVGRLIKALNRLMWRLNLSMERQRQFTADASHDLRTPLTILKGEIQLALSRDRSVAEYREVLDSALIEVGRLSRIVADLGNLAASESMRKPGERMGELVEIGSLCKLLIESRSSDAASRKISLAVNIERDVELTPVSGSIVDIERIFANLISNAIKYNHPGGYVRLDASINASSEVVVAVSDGGRGISSDDLDHVFERFYRVDKARTSSANESSSGSGLGLAIAKSLVEEHGGRIAVESRLGEGSCFTVYLPGATASEAPDEIVVAAGFRKPKL